MLAERTVGEQETCNPRSHLPSMKITDDGGVEAGYLGSFAGQVVLARDPSASRAVSCEIHIRDCSSHEHSLCLLSSLHEA